MLERHHAQHRPEHFLARQRGGGRQPTENRRLQIITARLGKRPPAAQQQPVALTARPRTEEHTSGLQALMRISYAVFCLQKKKMLTSKSKCFYEYNQHTQTNMISVY